MSEVQSPQGDTGHNSYSASGSSHHVTTEETSNTGVMVTHAVRTPVQTSPPAPLSGLLTVTRISKDIAWEDLDSHTQRHVAALGIIKVLSHFIAGYI